jgi:transcriptional regulator with XRE-family HTH domain
MRENNTAFTKEMIKLLKQRREKANLTQEEIAQRLGFSPKSGKMYISAFERGKKRNPSIDTILKYLRACGASWVEFFKELDRIDFKLRHEKMISQVKPPPAERKIQRDAMKYEINIEFPSKEKEEIDFVRLKQQIKDKVLILLSRNQIGENQIILYQKFAREYFEFLAALNKPGMKILTDKYQRTGLKPNQLFKIKKIINSVLRGEIKRIASKKPLPTAKQEKMAIGFTKYRIVIERIEAEIHKLLCDSGVKTVWFVLYKDFAREFFQTLKKYYNQDTKIFAEKLKNIIDRWQKEGLPREILIQLQKKIESMVSPIKKF